MTWCRPLLVTHGWSHSDILHSSHPWVIHVVVNNSLKNIFGSLGLGRQALFTLISYITYILLDQKIILWLPYLESKWKNMVWFKKKYIYFWTIDQSQNCTFLYRNVMLLWQLLNAESVTSKTNVVVSNWPTVHEWRVSEHDQPWAINYGWRHNNQMKAKLIK
jgi:hypothetical protein